MNSFSNREAAVILPEMIRAIEDNKQYLSDIDGAIGDGDHGVNMNKGFALAGEKLTSEPGDFSHGLSILGRVLMMKIGGSMGPLYGTLFKTMGKVITGNEMISTSLFREALTESRAALQNLTPARVGDKTLVDALYPAIEAFNQAVDRGESFGMALERLHDAAAAGRDRTRDMEAKLGRSSRLGARSQGTIDAGAASCALLLGVMAHRITSLLREPVLM